MTAEFYALKGMFLAQINKYVCYIGSKSKTQQFLNGYLLLEADVKVKLEIGMIW